MRVLILVLIFLLNDIGGGKGNAQVNRYNDSTFTFSVKQFDEFISRFNGNISKEIAESINDVAPRRDQLVHSLFNQGFADRNQALVDEFVKDVTRISDPKFLDYYASKWYAEVNADFLHNGNKCEATLRLKPEVYANYASKWVVYQIEADNLKPTFQPNTKSTFLSPASNETGFINLYSFFDNRIDPTNILPSNYNYDVTTLFLNEIAEGNIKDFKMRDNKYHIYQIDGWYFSVLDFVRNTSNSGWLINDLKKL